MKTMKKLTLITVIVLLAPGLAHAQVPEYFDLPSVPDAEIVSRTQTRVEVTTPLSHDEVVEYYKQVVEQYEDIRFRDWAESTYIEDNGALKWHSVTISKKAADGLTTVVISKDNWTWIIGTLILRFIGVFVVLIVLLGAMTLSGAVVSRVFKASDEPPSAAPPVEGYDEQARIAAAIAAARKFENR
jgi:Na+-transporting methylmalonyl-CoA/oxaloacetate decarboxylase gamma subunit